MKIKLKKKEDNNLYIEIPPRFPNERIEINLPKKYFVIYYDELMKKTFQNIYNK